MGVAGTTMGTYNQYGGLTGSGVVGPASGASAVGFGPAGGGGGVSGGLLSPSLPPPPSLATGAPSLSPGFPTPSGGGATTSISTPPAPVPQKAPGFTPGAATDPNLATLASAGTGLLDPDSDYYQRLNEGMRAEIGQQSGALQRAAALRAAQSGMGTGASPELLETQGLIGRAGQVAMGDASAGLRLQAPQLGGQLTAATFGPTQQQFGLAEQSKQFGQSQAQQAGQFNAGLASGQWGMGLQAATQQQGQAAQNAQFQAQLAQQQQEMQMQRYLAELNMSMGGIG